MIIFAKSDGTVIETKPTPFYQGSSLKGSIYLVAPFPNTNGVTIQFQLPNGNVTKAYPMTPTGEVEGVMLDGYELSAWTWDVKNAMVTAIPGVVTATIKVIDTDDNVTSIVSSFSIIKGTPSALNPSTPDTSEWQAIISALGSIGGKVAMPLMTNFTYNIATGKSEKTYNNGMRQTENFPAVLPKTMTKYQSFTRTVFYESNWRNSDRQGYNYMYTFELPTLSSSENDFAIDVYSRKEYSERKLVEYKKMDPIVIISKSTINSSMTVSIYSNEPYSGDALFFWKGSFAEQNYKEEIEKAIDDCEGATAQAENIANTLETAYENGELGIPNGGTVGQVLTKTENGTAWQNATSGGGGGNGGSTFLYSCQGMYDYAGPQFKFWIPIFDGVKKIEVLALNYCDTSAGVLLSYQEVITNSVIYENGTKSGFLSGVVGNTVSWTYGENSMNFPIVGNFVETEAGTYPQLILKITM